MAGRKITLGAAAASGAIGVLVYCGGALGRPCRRSGEHGPLAALLARYGPDRRLDELPFRCSACGARSADVRPAWPNPGGGVPSTYGMVPRL